RLGAAQGRWLQSRVTVVGKNAVLALMIVGALGLTINISLVYWSRYLASGFRRVARYGRRFRQWVRSCFRLPRLFYRGTGSKVAQAPVVIKRPGTMPRKAASEADAGIAI